jgi:DNA-directed RNA polymerase subunit RPC12/RpoP
MTNELKPCKECGSETIVTTLASFSGEEGPVTVTIDGMPAVVCAHNHRRFLYADFAPMLLDFVADPEKFAPQPPAVKRGLIKKHYHCSGCGAELPADSTTTSAHSVDAIFKRAAPFTIMLNVALYKCEQCGREQVRSNDELSESVVKAISHGFRAMDIHADR